MRILFIAEPASIHAARWINQLQGYDWDVHISPGCLNCTDISPDLKIGTVHHCARDVTPQGINRGAPAPANHSELVHSLTNVLDTINPDYVHILGLCVNSVNRALAITEAIQLKHSKNKIPIIYSSWGTDLDYFGSLPEYQAAIKQVLPLFDYHISECDRDIRLAKIFGFKGKTLEKLPAFGGTTWSQESFPFIPTSGRQLIYLKARDLYDGDPIGRAMTVMTSMLYSYQYFAGKSVGLFQAGKKITQFSERLASLTSLTIKNIPRLPLHTHLLEAMSHSCIFAAVTSNDGLPSTLVEAMSLGAFPIHSNLEPIREWITDGENGLLVDHDDVIGTAKAFKRALTDTEFVNHAIKFNIELVKQKLSDAVIKPKSRAIYTDLLSLTR